MSEKITTLRIDEILLFDGLVTEEHIKTALEYQREHGGRIGSHLVRLGYLNEAGLIQALAKQFDCESVVLGDADIPRKIIKLIPSNVAVARRVIPFDYDSKTNILKVACDNPNNEDLINELNFVAAGKKVQLFIAAEMALGAAVAKHYVAGIKAPSGSSEAPLSNTGEMTASSLEDSGTIDELPPRGSILLVTDERDADRPLAQALDQENFELVLTDSADDAIDIIGNKMFHTVFIRDTVQGDYIDLIDRLRKVSPRTNVRYYESTAQLLLDQESYTSLDDMVGKNMQLFTTLLSSCAGQGESHAGIVGRYVDRLCKQIGLPDRDRMIITNAAYLHDVSRFYYGESDDNTDCRSRISLTAKLLDSLNYSPLVIEILRATYINLRQKYTKRLPIEKLGGNIITIVDIFCENVSVEKKMSLDRFEVVRNKLHSLSGKLFLPEVVAAFIEMIEKDILIEPPSTKYNQALAFCEDPDLLAPIFVKLKSEGFRPVAPDTLERFFELYERSRPDVIILLVPDRPSKAITLVDDLVKRGVEIMKVPTFLLTNQESASELTSMFEQGIEDIITIENGLDMLVAKMCKLRERIELKTKAKQPSANGTVTTGNIADMSLIDLLQALGPSNKTARIGAVSGEQQLNLFLKKGQIIYAEGCGKIGAEAVYEALGWTEGTWVIQPISESDLPEPNNDHPNESILMEGCRLLDEKSRTETA